MKKAEVSWLDWDRWTVKCCECGTEIEMEYPKPFLKCPKCGAEYFMTNYIFWKREKDPTCTDAW